MAWPQSCTSAWRCLLAPAATGSWSCLGRLAPALRKFLSRLAGVPLLAFGLGHTGAHVVSAAVEAVCFQLAEGLEELERPAEGEIQAERRLEVVVNGGAVERSQWWKFRLAAALGRPTLFSSVPETTARGAAAKALGVELGRSGVEAQVVEPAEEDIAALVVARRRWAEYYEKMLPIVTNRGG